MHGKGQDREDREHVYDDSSTYPHCKQPHDQSNDKEEQIIACRGRWTTIARNQPSPHKERVNTFVERAIE